MARYADGERPRRSTGDLLQQAADTAAVVSEGSATPPGPDPKAERERQEETVSKPGGFKNDPDDPTNPNEAIERSRRSLRHRVSGGD
jgi:hypothetical protein